MTHEEVPQPAAPQGLSRGAVLLMLAVVGVALGWIGVSVFKSDPASDPATEESAIASDEPLPRTAPATVASPPETVLPTIEPEVRPPPDAPTASVNEVIPDVPRSALDTIRGTVRVAVRVTIDKQGMVVGATATDRGPSRYFERLALEASKQWTFTPATQQEQRAMLIRFNFTRSGATAQANPP